MAEYLPSLPSLLKDQPNTETLIILYDYFIQAVSTKGHGSYRIHYKYLNRRALANSVHPDQTPQNVASDQGIHCLPFSWTSFGQHQAVKGTFENKYFKGLSGRNIKGKSGVKQITELPCCHRCNIGN